MAVNFKKTNTMYSAKLLIKVLTFVVIELLGIYTVISQII